MAIGRVNTGGSGSGGTLTVTGVAGHTVTATKDGKTYTRTFNSGGVAVFKGLSTGTWTVTMAGGGQTATRTVTVNADYAVTITYFAATINVTYPANSNCVVANSGGQTVASDTNTGTSAKTWTATVNAKGTYTVTATATDGSGKTKSTTVSITADGQSKSVTLVYWDGTIYDAGNEYTAQTGGWTCVTTGDGAKATKTNNQLFVSVDQTSSTAYARTANKISLTGFTKIQATVSAQTHSSSWGGNERCKLLVSANADLSDPVASVQPTTNNAQTLSLDINLTGTYYVGIKAAAGTASSASMTVTKIKLA